MDVLGNGFTEALRLLWERDPETMHILWLSLRVSLTATFVALIAGLPVGMALAVGRFPGRRLMLALVNTGMGLPPVVAGLFVTVMLWRSGPLGALSLLYTPTGMIIAQALIATPIVAAISTAALQQVDPEFRTQMLGIGAGRLRSLYEVAREARLPLLAAVMAGFGGVISEVGAAMMVGGNIRDQTRVLTTAAVQQTSMGNFGAAIAYGLILLAIAFLVVLVLTLAQQRTSAWQR
ncbi:MAG: ABC transporter permease [Gaiellales bacterium]